MNLYNAIDDQVAPLEKRVAFLERVVADLLKAGGFELKNQSTFNPVS